MTNRQRIPVETMLAAEPNKYFKDPEPEEIDEQIMSSDAENTKFFSRKFSKKPQNIVQMIRHLTKVERRRRQTAQNSSKLNESQGQSKAQSELMKIKSGVDNISQRQQGYRPSEAQGGASVQEATRSPVKEVKDAVKIQISKPDEFSNPAFEDDIDKE